MSRVLPAAAITVVAGIFVGIALGIVGQRAQAGWDADQRTRDSTILNAPSRTDATLTAVEPDPDDHRNPTSLHYAFAVDGITYAGADYSGEGGNPPYSELARGDQIHITYYKVDPHVSCACDPVADIGNLEQVESSFGRLAGAISGTAVAALAAVAFFVYGRYGSGKPAL